MTNSITIQPIRASLLKHTESHALYNGVVFVVWAFGIYICCCAIKKLSEAHD